MEEHRIKLEESIESLVEAAVREEFEQAITEEIKRRLVAVEAALNGSTVQPQRRRKPRKDKGVKRGPKVAPKQAEEVAATSSPDDDDPTGPSMRPSALCDECGEFKKRPGRTTCAKCGGVA